MTPQEANRIIAEYMSPGMGGNITCMIKYNQSLDALVPVWEKLAQSSWEYEVVELLVKTSINGSCYPTALFTQDIEDNKDLHLSRANTIQEAAAIATARTIRGLTC